MRKKAKFLTLVAMVILFGFLFRFTPLSSTVSRENLLAFFESTRESWWGPLVFILIYAVGCVIYLPGSVLTLAGGAVFGTAWGTIYNILASNLGATLAFLMARFLGRDFVKGLIKSGKLSQFDQNIEKTGFKTIFRLRLIPLIPFNGLNFGAGLSSVRYRDYFWGSLLGMIPATFIYTYFADALLQGVQGASQKAFLNLLIASLLLISISFLPSIYKRIKGANAHGTV